MGKFSLETHLYLLNLPFGLNFQLFDQDSFDLLFFQMVLHEIMIVCFFNVLALAIFALNSFKFIYMKLEHR